MSKSDQWSDFEFDQSDSVAGLIKVLAVGTLVGLAIVVGVYAAGFFTGEDAVINAIFLISVLGASSVHIWLMRRGVVRISPSRLEVRTRFEKQYYAWDDIAEVRVIRRDQMALMDRLWWAVMRVDTDRRLVELRLRRSLRISLRGGRSGTDIDGIPTLIFKIARVYVVDIDRFAQIVERLIPGRVRMEAQAAAPRGTTASGSP